MNREPIKAGGRVWISKNARVVDSDCYITIRWDALRKRLGRKYSRSTGQPAGRSRVRHQIIPIRQRIRVFDDVCEVTGRGIAMERQLKIAAIEDGKNGTARRCRGRCRSRC